MPIKKLRCAQPSAERTIMLENPHRGGMKWDRPWLAELAGTDVQPSVGGIEIAQLQTQGLAGAQAGAGQQPDQRLIGQWMQRGLSRWQRAGAPENPPQLRRGVEMGPEALNAGSEQSSIGDLGRRIGRCTVSSERPHHPQSTCVGTRLGCRNSTGPAHRQCRGKPRSRSQAIRKAPEIHKQPGGTHRIAEPLPGGQITANACLHRCPRGSHRGQGWASARRSSAWVYRSVVATSRCPSRSAISLVVAPEANSLGGEADGCHTGPQDRRDGRRGR